MDPKLILEKIRTLEIKTKHLTKEVLSGEYHAAFKGRGMAFSEVRNYQLGDEIRTIDWNVTARFNEPFVKVFEEERELNVFLVMDVSNSLNYGTEKTKQELALELAAVLSFSAVQNNDKIGAVFFSDEMEKYIQPLKGRKHALAILRDLAYLENKSQGTNLKEALNFVQHMTKKRSVIFVVSDFSNEEEISDSLARLRRKHDVVAIRLADDAEYELPKLGFIPLKDLETGKSRWVNSSSQKFQDQYRRQLELKRSNFFDQLKRKGVDGIEINTKDDFYPALVALFHRRLR
jgi:uncharacterized protein (DUF58 family)